MKKIINKIRWFILMDVFNIIEKTLYWFGITWFTKWYFKIITKEIRCKCGYNPFERQEQERKAGLID